MKKSFKKVVACLLAVLMVAFSVPFTAFAATEDYYPDVDVVFGTLFDQGNFTAGPNMWFGTHDINDYDFSYAGPNNAPVTLNNNGQLVLTADATVPFCTDLLDDPDSALTEDYVLQNGDYFTVTVIAHNVDNILTLMTQLTFNREAICPAGYYTYKGGTKMGKNISGWGSIDEVNELIKADKYYKSGPTWTVGGANVLNDTSKAPLSCSNYYKEAVNYFADEISTVQTLRDDTAGAAAAYPGDITDMYLDTVVGQGDGGNVSTVADTYDYAGLQPNPFTGEYDGYYDAHDDRADHSVILETFMFKVVDNTKPLNFDIFDKENNIINHKYDQGKYIALGEDPSPYGYVTYAYNTYNGNYDDTASDPTLTENAGSRHMSFQGQYYSSSTPQVDEYTVTFKDADGAVIGTAVTGPTGTAVTAPDLADYAKAADADGHYASKWVVEGTTAAVTPVTSIGTENITYQVAYDSAAHNYTGQSQYDVVPATCTAGGSYKIDCADCGWTLNGTTSALGHTLTAVPAAAATCTADGNSAYWSCSECGKFFSDAEGTTEIAENSWVIPAAHQDVQHVAAVAPTTTENGNIEYWYCAACDKYFSDAALTNEITQAETIIEATGYTYAYDHMVFTENEGTVTAKAVYVAAEDTTKTKEYDAQCVITATTPATCTATGTAVWTATYEGNSDTYNQTLAIVAHTLTETPAMAATCTEAGNSAYYTCSVCGKYFSDANGETEIAADSWVIPASGHVVAETPAKAETCTEAGNSAYYTCSVCGKFFSDAEGTNEIAENSWVIPAKGHDYGAFTYDGADAKTHTKVCANDASHTVTEACSFDEGYVSKEATATEAGEMTYTCTVCGGTYTETIAKKATVTIAKTDLGSISSDIAELNTTGASVSAKLDFGTSYKVTATPVDGAEFVGWQIGNKIVTTNATYNSVAYANVTLIPVFVQKTAASEITVIWYDLYGNVIDTFEGTLEDFQNRDYPEAPARPGYEFTGWDTAKADVTTSATIWAQYKESAAGAYTITTDADVTIKLPDGIDNGSIPYNTQVTVSKSGTKAWKAGTADDAAIIAYGDSYTFYVGSDVAIYPVASEVTQAPVVNIIGADIIAGTTRYNYVASMSVPTGKVVDRGFVYGKNLANADLVITNEGNKGSYSDSGNVKVIHVNSTASEQFSLMYGISSGSRKYGTVKAFIIMANGDVIYSDMFTLDYATGAQVENI